MTETEPLRVLHVVLSLNPGGAERLVVDLATRLPAPHSAAICCLDERGAWADEAEAAGVPVQVLGRSPGFQPGLGRRLGRLAKETGASVLHCHQYSPFVYGCLAKLASPGLHLVFTEHGRLAGARVSTKRRVANAILGRVPGRFFAVCAELRGFMIQEGFPAGRLEVLYNGIEPRAARTPESRARARREWGLSDEDVVLGSIARLDPVKDLPTLIRAVVALTGPPAPRLVLVGDGPDREALERLVRDLGLAERVTFAGHRSDARDLIPAFDFYVNCSTYEGVSLTIIEAMAAAVPVVATDVGGTPEVVNDATNGRLVPAGQPDRLAATLRELMTNAAEADRLATAGRTTVEERFHFDTMMQSYLHAYSSGRRR